MIFPLNSALIGPASERPDPNDPKIPRNGSTPPIYICIDTLDVFQDVGRGWLLAGSIGGTTLAGVTSDGQTPGGVLINRLQAAGLTTALLPTPLQGVAIDPTYDPSHVYTVDDVATSGSVYGESLVTFESWTPTISGTVTLLPPELGNLAAEVDYYVYAGSAIGTEVPSLDGTGTAGSRLSDPNTYYSGTDFASPLALFEDTLDVIAGQTYTAAIATHYDIPASDAVGQSVPLWPWRLSTQLFGGQSHLVPLSEVTGPFASSGGLRSRVAGEQAHSDGLGGIASAANASVDGRFCQSTAAQAHSEGNQTVASAPNAHAEGDGSIVSGEDAHGEGYKNIVSGSAAHGEGGSNTVSGIGAHGEGEVNTVSGDHAHGEGSQNIIDGDQAHGEGHHNKASNTATHAMGHHAETRHIYSYAQAGGTFGADVSGNGDAQFIRIVAMGQTTDATPGALGIDTQGIDSGGPIFLPARQAWMTTVSVIASREDVAGTQAAWQIRACVTIADGTPRIIGTPDAFTVHDAGAAAWDVALTADANLNIIVTGEAGATIRWVATVQATCVGV